MVWIALAVSGLCPAPAAEPAPIPAAPVWQLAPYRVQVLLGVAAAADLGGPVEHELLQAVPAQCDSLLGGPWEVSMAAAAPALAAAMFRDPAGITAAALPKPGPDIDKVLLLAVTRPGADYQVAARDCDVRTGQWNPPVVLAVAQRVKLVPAAVRALVQAFAPLALVENVQAGQAVLWPKAADLEPRAKDLPAAVRAGRQFQVIVRTVGRDGVVASLAPVPGVLLAAEKIDEAEIRARIQSASGVMPPARNRKLVEPLALAIGPPAAATGRPAADRGGDVKQPGDAADQAAADKVAALQTEADGAALALADDLTDLVARREALLALARLRLEAGQFPAAAALLGQLRALPGREQFQQSIGQQQKRLSARTTDTFLQQQLEAAFAAVQAAADKHLDPSPLTKLADDLKAAQAKKAKKTAPDNK